MARYDFDSYRRNAPRGRPRGYDERFGGGARPYNEARRGVAYGGLTEWGGGWPDAGRWDAGGRDARGGGRGFERGFGMGGRAPGHDDRELYGSPYEHGDLYDDAGYSARRGLAGFDEGFDVDRSRGAYSWYGGGDIGAGDTRRRDAGADRVRVREIMTDSPEAVTPETTLADVARRMKDLNVGIIPVVDDATNRRLEGLITDRDLAVRALAEGRDGSATVRECMTREVESVTADASVREVMDTMKRSRVRRVPVVDGENRLVGIVAQADLAVDYAGLDREREAEVEEVIERISEPGRPRRGGYGGAPRPMHRGGYDRDLADRLRHGADRLRDEVQDGWRELRDTARQWIGRTGGERY